MSEDLYGSAIKVPYALRDNGQSVDLLLENIKSKWVFKHASRNEVKHCVIIGTDEYANGEVAVKDLELGEQIAAKIDALVERLVKYHNHSKCQS